MDYMNYTEMDCYKRLIEELDGLEKTQGLLPSEFRKKLPELNISIEDTVDLLNFRPESEIKSYLELINLLVTENHKIAPTDLNYRRDFIRMYRQLIDEYLKARITRQDKPGDITGYFRAILPKFFQAS